MSTPVLTFPLSGLYLTSPLSQGQINNYLLVVLISFFRRGVGNAYPWAIRSSMLRATNQNSFTLRFRDPFSPLVSYNP